MWFRCAKFDTLRSLALLTPILLWSGACSPEGASEPADTIEVAPPEDLEILDVTVREQFDEFWGRLQDLRRDPAAESADVGAAWGKLGQWFDVYSYDASASKCYANAQGFDTKEARWPYYLGLLAEKSGDLDAAEAHMQRAADLAPGETVPRVRLGDLALRRQDLDRADEIYRRILSESPEDPGARLGSAQIALMRGDAETAIAELQPLRDEQPEASQIQYFLALAWRQLGDEQKAREYFAAVPANNVDQVRIDLGSSWDLELFRLDRGARTLTRRGARARNQGEARKATVLMGMAVEANPTVPETRINYALALHEVGRTAAAMRELLTALELADEGSQYAARAHTELGRLLASVGRVDAAVEHLAQALEIDSSSVPAHAEFGRIAHRQGRIAVAVTHYGAIRQLDPSNVSASFWYGALLASLRRRADAMQALATDLERLGDDESTRTLRLLLARVLSTGGAEAGDVERAEGLLASSTPTVPDAFQAESRAMVEAARGRFDVAGAWQQAAVDSLSERIPRVAAQIARRRLVLYQRGEPAGLAWEPLEVPMKVPVEIP